MKGIIWNVRGLNRPGKTTCLNDVMRRYSPDFVGFSETKKESFTDNFLKSITDNADFIWN